MTKDNKQQKLSESTDTAIDYSTCYAQPFFDYIKCPLNKWTFKVRNIREWVEKNCEGKTLNLFAGITKLDIDEIRNDLGEHADADYQKDALQFLKR